MIPRSSASGSILAFDFGLHRTGAAVGDLSLSIAHPLEMIRARDDEARLRAIGGMIREWMPVGIVVGMPTTEDGSEHQLASHVRRFGESLQQRFGVPVDYVDERLSSASASSALAEAGVRGRRQKPFLDSFAAREILRAYLEGRHAAA